MLDRVLEWFMARMVWHATTNPVDGDAMDEALRQLSYDEWTEATRRWDMYVAWRDATLYRIGKSE